MHLLAVELLQHMLPLRSRAAVHLRAALGPVLLLLVC
jgi:hypothetical protein